MTVPQKEAGEALENVENVEQRSVTAYRYRKFSPHLFLWGVIWIIGYTVPYFHPGAWRIWFALVPVGVLAAIWIDKRSRRFRGWNYGVECLAIFLFIYAVYMILPPKSTAQGAALFPLVIAVVYVFLGMSTRAAASPCLAHARGIDGRRILLAAAVYSVVGGWRGRRRFDLRWLLAEEGVN